MAATSDQIRQDIDDTRSRLSREIDELADRTLPHRIVKRHWPGRRRTAGRNGVVVTGGRDPDALPGGDAALAEPDSVLDPEPNDVTDAVRRSARSRMLAVGVAAVGVAAILLWLLRSRSGRQPEE